MKWPEGPPQWDEVDKVFQDSVWRPDLEIVVERLVPEDLSFQTFLHELGNEYGLFYIAADVGEWTESADITIKFPSSMNAKTKKKPTDGGLFGLGGGGKKKSPKKKISDGSKFDPEVSCPWAHAVAKYGFGHDKNIIENDVLLWIQHFKAPSLNESMIRDMIRNTRPLKMLWGRRLEWEEQAEHI